MCTTVFFSRQMFFMASSKDLFLIFIIIIKIYTICLSFKKIMYFFFLNCQKFNKYFLIKHFIDTCSMSVV